MFALLLTGCEDGPPADDGPPPRPTPAAKVEHPEPPYGGEVGPEGRTLRCPSRRIALTRPWWYAYSDRDSWDMSCPTGTSESRLHTVEVTEDTGSCTVGWSGTLQGESEQHTFAGVGTELAWADLSPYTAVTVMTRGDGQRYRMELIADLSSTDGSQAGCDDPSWDVHGAQLVCGDGTAAWRPVTLKLSAFRQEGWGTPRELDLSQVNRLHVRTGTSTKGSFACDFWIQSVTMKGGERLQFQ